MKINLKYLGDELVTQIPDDKIAWIVEPKYVEPCNDEEEEIRNAIQTPIGLNSLKDLVKEKGTRTVILVDDLTRTTPQKKILPILIKELNDAGVKDDDITIIVALGTHRGMTNEECIRCYSSEIVERIKIINHNGYNPEELVDIGVTPTGIPINVNKLYYESDISIAVGNIIPHVYAGWSGGAKMIQPGVSGPITTARTHLISTKFLFDILGNADNVVRLEMEEIARKTGLTMIINTVMNSDGTLVKVVAGDVVKAHREGVEWSRKIYSSNISVNPDIALINAYPGNLDLWQSTKAMTAGSIFVKPQGTVILVTPAPEGIPRNHPVLRELGSRGSEEVTKAVEDGEIQDEVAATVHITISRCREKAEIILVSQESNKQVIEELGLKYFGNLDDALEYAYRKHGAASVLGIATHGADLAP